MDVEKTTVLATWNKFGVGASPDYQTVEVHLRERVIDGQTFIELRDFFPEAMEYGRGYLIRYGGRRVDGPSHITESLRDILAKLEEHL